MEPNAGRAQFGLALNCNLEIANQSRLRKMGHSHSNAAPTAMIVCSCHVISDTDLRDALVASDRPVRHLRDIYAQAGVSPQCGRCAPTVRHVASMAGAVPSPENL